MIPPIEKFKEAMKIHRGNLSQVARAFGVSRHAVYDWINKNSEYKSVLDDARGEFLDDVISTARLLATGIPLKDSDGNFAGYQIPPDPSMCRYILSTLGRNDGFGERIDVKADVTTKERLISVQEAREIIERLEKEY